MESKATFKERALDIGLEAALVTELIAKGVDRFSRLAYVCSANPTSGDDTKLKRALEDLLGHELQPVAMIGIRQLWFESYTLAMTELEDRVKKSPTDIPKSIPLAERMARIERQRTKLVGLIYDQHTEPAHGLTDKAHAMLEDGVISYIPPSKCPSRHDEIQGNKSEQSVTFDTHGNLKIQKKAAELACDVTGELRLRQAFTRKSLAMDQAGLCSFDCLEMWHNQLFQAMMKQPPAGHKYVTIQQVLNADKEMWLTLSQDTRGALRVAAGADPPLDAHVKKLRSSPQILCFIAPLLAGRNDEVKINPVLKGDGGKKKGDDDKDDKGAGPANKRKAETQTVKDMLKSMPQNCVSKLSNGKFICLHYNHGTCKRQKNSSCNMGAHVCYYKGCGQKRPYIECKH